MGDESSSLIELGAIGAPFGVRGWVKLRSFTDPPEALLERRSLALGRGEKCVSYRVEARGRSGGQLTAKLEGIEDRDQAQLLRGAPIYVARSELPTPVKGDYYRADLIGCGVLNVAGVKLGTLAYFVDSPAHAHMVVRGGDGGRDECWIPAIPRHLKRVDLEARQVVVDWDPAA